jgi:hypothetical protein
MTEFLCRRVVSTSALIVSPHLLLYGVAIGFEMNSKSGIQKEVVALYRTLLRECIKKDRAGGNGAGASVLLHAEHTVSSHAREKFREQAGQVGRKDFRTIEYRIRHGYKQIKLLQMPGLRTFKSFTT